MKVKRWIIQLVFFLIQNPFLQNFFTGTIHKGSTKSFCTPGLHCYSCPAAAFSCPIGTIQFIFDYAKAVPFYAFGLLTVSGTLFGSATCAYVCPFGFFQEIIYKISPFKKYEAKLPRIFRYTKYLVLVFMVILIPFIFHIPSFCAYLCPSGTFTAGVPLLLANEGYRATVGMTFVWKITFFIALVFYAMREKRPFCRYLCPLGLFLGFFNKISLYRIKLNSDKCRHCKVCFATKTCPMGLNLPDEIDSIDCIKCGECIDSCTFGAIEKKGLKFPVKESEN